MAGVQRMVRSDLGAAGVMFTASSSVVLDLPDSLQIRMH
jgi:phosphoenolpyruvate synthase/pyruvate phosphate dikinase